MSTSLSIIGDKKAVFVVSLEDSVIQRDLLLRNSTFLTAL